MAGRADWRLVIKALLSRLVYQGLFIKACASLRLDSRIAS
jgi:hypothetical protein